LLNKLHPVAAIYSNSTCDNQHGSPLLQHKVARATRFPELAGRSS